MNQCKNTNKLLHLFASNELNDKEREKVINHISNCEECNGKLLEIQLITDCLTEDKNNALKEFESINWNNEAFKFKNAIESEKVKKKTSFFRFAQTFSYVFIMVFAVSLFYFSPNNFNNNGNKNIIVQKELLAKMESQLDRGDIIKSLNRGSLIINDFLKQCNSTEELNDMFHKKQVEKLLKQNRYIMGNLKSDNLASAKKMLGQINYLLYEMSSIKGNKDCKEVKPIQDFVIESKLLLKIKLIKDELKYKELS